MAYLEWKTRGYKYLKLPWVELAVQLRKGENKIGGKRTKLERLARKHLQERRRHKGCEPSRNAAREFALGQLARQVAIHDPEAAKKRGEIAREWMRKRSEENNHPGVRDWVITSKETGDTFIIRNLRAFCREHDINYRNLHFTAVSNWWAKGYRARKFDALTDGDIPTREEYEKGLGG